ncbi:chemotaxis protein CheA [Labilibacter marinus]|uniref:chemotaxis protein CheA n=1 Tax=Labilibacter marinus TaxID=1477105 RepID=UPI00094FDFA8|nr:chemotaxis protein CheA [Labilibacter marinus]
MDNNNLDVNNISQFKHLFIEEATNLLNSMESIILQLEENPNNLELIQEVFRVMHTIKGVSGMYGYTAMGELTHQAENIYDLIRSRKLNVDKEILSTTLIIVDQLFALLKDENHNCVECKEKQEQLIDWCKSYSLKATNESSQKEIHIEQLTDKDMVTYNIIMHTNQSVVDRRINIFYAVKDLAEIGEIRSINPLPVDSNEEERWSIFVVGNFDNNDIEEALMFVYEFCIIRKVADFDIFKDGQLDLNQKQLQLEEEAREAKEAPEIKDPIAPIINPQQTKATNTDTMIASIKQNMNRVSVESEKLDYLMYLVSELITTSSQLNLSSTEIACASIRPQIEKLDRLSKQFRNNALDIRLIPIRDIVPKFNRLVRDISLNLEKKVEFVTEGMETELDKSSIDMIAEPMVHMLRNALDHGIETPEERISKGKDAKGKITLKAGSSGNTIFIKISDDGKGFDKNKIFKHAIDKGFIEPDAKLTDKEIYNLICLPGFSTADAVTNISGRGVGMDVVKQKISKMRGELEISSTQGEGTTFTIRLQQSIAILDTLLVASGKMKFLIPLSDVDECSQKYYSDVEKRIKFGTVDYEEELIPFISLRSLFELNGETKKMAKMIVITKNKKRIAIFADQIIGQHQAVLKPMGELVKSHKEISAASVLGNGEVAFLLDTTNINQEIIAKN